MGEEGIKWNAELQGILYIHLSWIIDIHSLWGFCIAVAVIVVDAACTHSSCYPRINNQHPGLVLPAFPLFPHFRSLSIIESCWAVCVGSYLLVRCLVTGLFSQENSFCSFAWLPSLNSAMALGVLFKPFPYLALPPLSAFNPGDCFMQCFVHKRS